MQAMVGRGIGLIDQRIMALHHLNPRVSIIQLRDVRIVQPQIRTRCPHIREETPGVTTVQIPHRRGEHDNVSGGKPVFEDEFAHGTSRGGGHSLAANQAGGSLRLRRRTFLSVVAGVEEPALSGLGVAGFGLLGGGSLLRRIIAFLGLGLKDLSIINCFGIWTLFL
jgi:hypothetical protein